VSCDSPRPARAIAAAHESGTGAPVLASRCQRGADGDLERVRIDWKNVASGAVRERDEAIDERQAHDFLHP
jgi:hypothetical protein